MADTNTAPAATSLAIFARGLYSWVTISTVFSTAVFIISVITTRVIAPRRTINSIFEKSKNRLAISTRKQAK